MSFAFRRNGAWHVGYTDQTGKAVMQRVDVISRKHAEDAAAKLEALGKRLRLGASLEQGEVLRAKAEGRS